MIRINLLPFRAARKKENVRKQASIFMLSIFLGVILLGYLSFMFGSKVGKMSTRIQETKTALAQFDVQAKEVDQIQKDLEVLKKKIDVITNLKSNRKGPVLLLDSLTQLVIPKRMWLTNLEAKGDGVNIKGVALDNRTVADFMTQLEKSKLFASVNLSTLNQKTIRDEMNLKSFIITCNKAAAENTVTSEAKKQ
ncbi:MAG: PilN domain-containing protein [Desulfobacteraceae bacterium]|jgi:type IV pilus assembly protein PilN|nr:PilN domain-containing protein [Desulfobacteraceae bacterium]